MPEPAVPKRRSLAVPLAVLALALLIIGGWSAWWWTARTRLEEALAAAGQAQGAGGLSWRGAEVSGYPFRLRVTLTDARATLPDGVGVAAPVVLAETYAYRPTRWVATAPQGLVILRPVAGPVDVRGRVLRASAVDLAGRPRFAFEGRDLVLTPRAGADPFLLDTVRSLRVEALQGPAATDEAAVLIRLEGGRARPAGLLSYVGGGGETALELDALISRASRFSGADAGAAARRWSAVGGAVTLRRAVLRAGANSAATERGQLSVAPDGRLRGRLDLILRGGPLAMAGLGRTEQIDDAAAARAADIASAREDSARVSRLAVVFEAGVTTVGPVAIGPSPRVFP